MPVMPCFRTMVQVGAWGDYVGAMAVHPAVEVARPLGPVAIMDVLIANAPSSFYITKLLFDNIDWNFFFEIPAYFCYDDTRARIMVIATVWARQGNCVRLNQLMARRAGLVTMFDRFQAFTGLGFRDPRRLVHKNGIDTDFRRSNLAARS